LSKVFISSFPFSRNSELPKKLLEESGFEFALNTSGKKLTRDEIYEQAKDADAIIAGTEDITGLIEKSQKLKLIARIGIGLDSVPLELCREKGIKFCYNPYAVTDAVDFSYSQSALRQSRYSQRWVAAF